MPARRCVGIGLGGDALDRHLHEVRIAARLGAVGEGDLQHLGQQMERVHRAEAQLRDVVAFEDVQHLRDVHARRGGRRRADDLPAAIAAADRRALDHAVVGEVLARDEAAGPLHALDQQVAERAAMQRRLALLGDQGQRLGVVALHQALAGLERRAVGQQAVGGERFVEQVGGGALDAVGEIGRDREAARGVADRGLHHVGERHRAVASKREAPGAQRAGRGHRLRPDLVLAALDVVDLRRGAGDRPVHVGWPASGTALMPSMIRWLPSARRIWQVVPPIRPTIIGSTTVSANWAATAASIGVAAGGQHLHAGGGGQRMVRDHHAAAAMRRLLLAGELRAGALPPVRLAHVSRSFP